MQFELRDYQKTDINKLRTSLMEKGSVIYNLPTGGGKTASTSYMLQSLAKQGKKGWFICHRRELLEQSSAAFTKQGIQHGIIGGNNKFQPDENIQVCSALSLLNKMDDLPQPDFVIWDECHHIAAATWDKIFNKVEGAKHLGLSATPVRLDGKGLDDYFNEIIKGLSMKDLISQGYLSPYKLYAPSIPDLQNLGKINGDFNEGQLESIVKKSFIFGDILEHWNKYAANKRTVIFCSSVEHSQEVAEDFCEQGIKASHVDGNTPSRKRSEIISDFETGKIQVLTNVDLISEGFDLPAIECVVLLRPTMSLGLYLQQVGRAMRVFPGKKEALILDHSGNSLRHGLPDDERDWNLEGRDIVENSAGFGGRVCGSCKTVMNYNRKICVCGELFETESREIVYLDGSLVEVRGVSKSLERSGVGSLLTKDKVIKIIDLYFNEGWDSISIQEDFLGCKYEKNLGAIISNIVKNKTWKMITRPNIMKEELGLRQSKFLFDKSYDIDPDNNCWNVKTHKSLNTISRIRYLGERTQTHRVGYLLYRGELKKGMNLHHKCKNIFCVNPDHLELISNSERAKRAKPVSEEERARRSNMLASASEKARITHPNGSRNRINKTPISICNNEGTMKFDSQAAAAKYLGVNASVIGNAITNDYKCKGYNIQKENLF